MPFDGNGNYVPVGAPDFPAIPSTVIRASQYNNQVLDIAAALSNCVTRDGQSLILADLSMGGHKLTGLGTPTVTGDSLAYGRKAEVTDLVASTLVTTDSLTIPTGPTGNRPSAGVGMLYCNTTLNQFEGYVNGLWQSVGSGQMLGTATVKGVFYNAQTITGDLTIKAGTNGGSFGPMTINDGVTVTIEDGAVWSIV